MILKPAWLADLYPQTLLPHVSHYVLIHFSHINGQRATARADLCRFSNIKNTSNTYKRHPSGNSGKKSSQLKNHPNNQSSKVMDTSIGRTFHDQIQGHGHKEITAFGICPSKVSEEPRNSFDSARISQWAAHSANGSSTFPDHGAQDQGTFSYDNDLVPAGVSSQIPTHFSVSSSNAFHTPVHPTPVTLQYGPGFTYNETSTAVAVNDFPGTAMDHGILQGQGLCTSSVDGHAYSNELLSDMDSHVYAAFAAGEFLPLDPVEAHPPSVLGNSNNNDGLAISSAWDAPRADLAQSLGWSPVSDFTPSSSSMRSSNSFVGNPPDTPVSGSMYDGIFMTGQNAQIGGETAMIPSFNMGDVMVDPSSMNYLDPESTIRPHQNFQRAPLPLDMWSGYDVASPSHGTSTTYTGYEGSRRSSEGESKVPRDHSYYKATPTDGLYHCPYAKIENCTHKPEKLKCNYDKHLDSHLKPYRCKSFECSQIQFSSTACLLRHEREAHGMHGHGPKPHLCYFKDCERAQEDNGFPRRWNLFDHMKRVHDFAGTEPSNKSTSPAPSSSSPEPHADLPKKRRTPSPIAEGPTKRVKVNAANRSVEASSVAQNKIKAKTTAVEPEYRPQSLDELWYDQLVQVQTRLQSLNPRDPRQWQQYQADTAQLQTIRLTMQFQQAQLAH